MHLNQTTSSRVRRTFSEIHTKIGGGGILCPHIPPYCDNCFNWKRKLMKDPCEAYRLQDYLLTFIS